MPASVASEQIRIPCLRCFKPPLTCYCAQVRPFRTQMQLVLLQHPLERKKTIGTARIAHLCVANSIFIGGEEFQNEHRVQQLISDPGNQCVVLFPGANSIDLSTELGRQQWQEFLPASSSKRLVVFVIDGTWACAKRMLRVSPIVAELPRISLGNSFRSEYHIRKQPREGCVSTIEAVHHLLDFLEPSLDHSILLEVFRTTVAQQIVFKQMNPDDSRHAQHALRRAQGREARQN